MPYVNVEAIKCSVIDCNRLTNIPGTAKGLCGAHYRRLRKYGDPTAKASKTETKIERWIRKSLLSFDTEECVGWPFHRNARGYGSYTLGGRPHIASRIICERVHGAPPEPHYHAAHSCGSGHLGCVNPKHLRWATPSENARDKIASGTSSRGEGSATAKLTDEQVREIRAAKGTARYDQIAARYGISKWTVGDIMRRKRWKHLPEVEAA